MHTHLLAHHAAVILFVVSIVGTGSCACIREYHELESSLLSSSINIDSLTKTFFPPNLPNPPIITVLYYLSGPNLTDHPVNILEKEGLETDGNEVLPYDYQFRWSENPVYLFMDPNILEVLSLYSIRIRSHTARLLVDPICKNYSINGVPLPEVYLNQMTSLLKSYTIKRKISVDEGIEERYQGYSSYFNSTLSDFTVIEYNADYDGNALLLIFSLIALAMFVTLGIPLLITANYKAMYTSAKEKDSNNIFIVWATAVVGTIVVILVLAVDIYALFIKRLNDGVPSVWQYYVGISFVILFFVFDFILALSIRKESDFPLPDVLKPLCCQTDRCCRYGTLIPQTLGIWLIIMAAQIITFHSAFIFLALIANPVQTISTNLLYLAALFCGISLVTLFFASFRKKTITHRNKYHYIFRHTLYVVLFFCVLAFMILFATCFLRVTVYVGGANSGGLPSLFASLAPSALLAGLGFLAKRVLEKYGTQSAAETTQYDSSSSQVALALGDVTCRSPENSETQSARKRPVSPQTPPIQTTDI